uniref:MI domain-containing protein n=1 Tax=Arcella intermedia TaxID=1963864 RepID=A0A6B2KYA2_9EUKA
MQIEQSEVSKVPLTSSSSGGIPLESNTAKPAVEVDEDDWEFSNLEDHERKAIQLKSINLEHNEPTSNYSNWNQDSSSRNKIMYTRDFLMGFKTIYVQKPKELEVFHEIQPEAEKVLPKEKEFEKFPPKVPSHPPKATKPKFSGNWNDMKASEKLPPSHIAPPRHRITRGIDEETMLIRNIQSLLNKLTPDKFDMFLHRLLAMNISCTNTLIKLIFEKAVTEHRYCDLYARLCFEISSQSAAQNASLNNPLKNFKRLLIEHCQKEFNSKTQPPKISMELDVEKRLQLEESSKRIKIHNLGLVKFIGELFKFKMLSESVIHKCLMSLITKSQSSDDLENFCVLMNAVGKFLDHREAQPMMNGYFERIKYYGSLSTITYDKGPVVIPGTDIEILSRIRFLLLDLVELRNSKWVPRKEVQKSKTIKEVHEDIETGKKEKKDRLREIETRAKEAARNQRVLARKAPLRKEDKDHKQAVLLKPDQKPKSLDVLTPDLQKELKSIIIDYWNSEEPEEIIDFLKAHQQIMSLLFEELLLLSIENSEREQQLSSDIITQFVNLSVLSKSDVEKMFVKLMAKIPELALDFPKIGDYLGTFMGNGILMGYLSPNIFSKSPAMPELISMGQAEKVVGNTLRTIARKSEDKAKEIIFKNAINLRSFLKAPSNFDRFLDQYNLRAVLSEGK